LRLAFLAAIAGLAAIGAAAGLAAIGAAAGLAAIGAGAAAAGLAAITGAAAAAGAAAFAAIAPSQPGAAVAGVQPALRQHKPEALPIFHCKVPVPLRQLSLLTAVPVANAVLATVTAAMNVATFVSFMVYPYKDVKIVLQQCCIN
jgi:hypothetical protein